MSTTIDVMAPHPLSPTPNEVRIGRRVVHLDPERRYLAGPDVIEDILWKLTDSADAVDYAERELYQRVEMARHLGISWRVIGDQLGVSRQAAHARFTERVRDAEAERL